MSYYRTENESLEDEVARFQATFTEFDAILGEAPIAAQQSAAKQVAKIVEGADVLEDPAQFWTWQTGVNKLMVSELQDRDRSAAIWQLLSPALQEQVRNVFPRVAKLYKEVKYPNFVSAVRRAIQAPTGREEARRQLDVFSQGENETTVAAVNRLIALARRANYQLTGNAADSYTMENLSRLWKTFMLGLKESETKHLLYRAKHPRSVDEMKREVTDAAEQERLMQMCKDQAVGRTRKPLTKRRPITEQDTSTKMEVDVLHSKPTPGERIQRGGERDKRGGKPNKKPPVQRRDATSCVCVGGVKNRGT